MPFCVSLYTTSLKSGGRGHGLGTATSLKNDGRGNGLGTATSIETGGLGNQGHVPRNKHLVQQILPFVTVKCGGVN